MRRSLSSTTVVEVYPGKLASAILGSKSYKEKKGTPEIRKELLGQLPIEMSEAVRQAAIEDPLGDAIDAVLAFYQARTWYEAGMPMPKGPAFELEGWII